MRKLWKVKKNWLCWCVRVDGFFDDLSTHLEQKGTIKSGSMFLFVRTCRFDDLLLSTEEFSGQWRIKPPYSFRLFQWHDDTIGGHVVRFSARWSSVSHSSCIRGGSISYCCNKVEFFFTFPFSLSLDEANNSLFAVHVSVINAPTYYPLHCSHKHATLTIENG